MCAAEVLQQYAKAVRYSNTGIPAGITDTHICICNIVTA